MFTEDELKPLVAKAIAEAVASKFTNQSTANAPDRMFEVGQKVLIRTVTYAAIGRVVRENSLAVYLEDASWVADTGRFSEALETGKLSEVEKCPGIRTIAIGAIVDSDPWVHDLPRRTK